MIVVDAAICWAAERDEDSKMNWGAYPRRSAHSKQGRLQPVRQARHHVSGAFTVADNQKLAKPRSLKRKLCFTRLQNSTMVTRQRKIARVEGTEKRGNRIFKGCNADWLATGTSKFLCEHVLARLEHPSNVFPVRATIAKKNEVIFLKKCPGIIQLHI